MIPWLYLYYCYCTFEMEFQQKWRNGLNRIYFAITYLKCLKGSTSTTFTFFFSPIVLTKPERNKNELYSKCNFYICFTFRQFIFSEVRIAITLFTTDLTVKPPYPYFCRYIFGYDYFNPYFPLLFWVGMFWKERPNLEANVGDRKSVNFINVLRSHFSYERLFSS